MDDMESDDDSYHGPFPLNGNFDGSQGVGMSTYSELIDRYHSVKGEEFEMIAWTPTRDCRVVFAVKASEERKASIVPPNLIREDPKSFGVKFVSAEVVLGDKASCERFMTEIEDNMG